jgi:hypothetical protein
MMQKFYHAVWIVGIVAHGILVVETWQNIDLYSLAAKAEGASAPISFYFDLSLAVIALLTFLILKHWVTAAEKKSGANNKAAE